MSICKLGKYKKCFVVNEIEIEIKQNLNIIAILEKKHIILE